MIGNFYQFYQDKLNYDCTKKRSFPLRISSGNVTILRFSADLLTFTEEILNGKIHFLCSEDCDLYFCYIESLYTSL